MEFYKRAVRYLIRKHSKTIILFFVLLITESMILCTVTILRASENAREKLHQKTKAKVTAEITDAKALITTEEAAKLQKLANIQSVNKAARVRGYPVGFGLYTGSDDSAKENAQIQFLGYDDLNADGPFADGQIRLVAGSYPGTDNEVIVNQKLADMNQWKLGNQVAIKNEAGEELNVVISGFYLSGMETKQADNTLAVYRIENAIYGTPEAALKLQEQKGFESVSVYALMPEQLLRLEQQVSRILGEKVQLAKSDALYQQMKQPLDQAVRVVKLMLYLTIGTAVIVITLLLCMWMRTRKKEVAIYISLGERKSAIFLQILLESILVFVFSTGASVLAGSCIAGLLKRVLFSENQIASFSLYVGVQGMDVIWLIATGTGILLFAAAVSLIPVLLANPKDTLSEMEG